MDKKWWIYRIVWSILGCFPPYWGKNDTEKMVDMINKNVIYSLSMNYHFLEGKIYERSTSFEICLVCCYESARAGKSWMMIDACSEFGF